MRRRPEESRQSRSTLHRSAPCALRPLRAWRHSQPSQARADGTWARSALTRQVAPRQGGAHEAIDEHRRRFDETRLCVSSKHQGCAVDTLARRVESPARFVSGTLCFVDRQVVFVDMYVCVVERQACRRTTPTRLVDTRGASSRRTSLSRRRARDLRRHARLSRRPATGSTKHARLSRRSTRCVMSARHVVSSSHRCASSSHRCASSTRRCASPTRCRFDDTRPLASSTRWGRRVECPGRFVDTRLFFVDRASRRVICVVCRVHGLARFVIAPSFDERSKKNRRRDRKSGSLSISKR